MGRRAVSPSGAVPLFLRRKDSATLPVCDRRVSYSAPHGQTAPPVTPKMEATANFACRRCTTACLLWPAGTTNQLHRVFLHHTVSEADSLGFRRQEARPILFVNRSDVPGCRWFLVPFSYFHRADLLQRPRQTCAKCCNQGCDTHKPPHLHNGAPLLNSGASFWAPTMQPSEGDESIWNLRSPQRAGTGIWSLLLPFLRVFYGSFRRCRLVDLLVFRQSRRGF